MIPTNLVEGRAADCYELREIPAAPGAVLRGSTQIGIDDLDRFGPAAALNSRVAGGRIEGEGFLGLSVSRCGLDCRT